MSATLDETIETEEDTAENLEVIDTAVNHDQLDHLGDLDMLDRELDVDNDIDNVDTIPALPLFR